MGKTDTNKGTTKETGDSKKEKGEKEASRDVKTKHLTII